MNSSSRLCQSEGVAWRRKYEWQENAESSRKKLKRKQQQPQAQQRSVLLIFMLDLFGYLYANVATLNKPSGVCGKLYIEARRRDANADLLQVYVYLV